jgi:hypothetical protein
MGSFRVTRLVESGRQILIQTLLFNQPTSFSAFARASPAKLKARPVGSYPGKN